MSGAPEDTPQEEEGDDLFYFESDHLALKGNRDYSEVLKTLFVLEAQRERAIKDYNVVVDIWKTCLDDPEGFLTKLKTGETLGVPDLQHIVDVPNINWSKYNVKIPEVGLKFLNSHKQSDGESIKAEDLKRGKHIRNTHNTPWTTEEQKRLEELLIIYPPEPIELRRFKKIAAALGNRTAQQVTSRVQKYFLKLYKAGLPIPGRIPKSAEKHKRSLLHKHQRHNHYLLKPTTFFPDLNIPVVMDENDQVPGPSTSASPNDFNSGNYLLPSGYENKSESADNKNEIDLQLNILKRVKMEKQKEEALGGDLFVHQGFQCDNCKEEPIVGSRWHCSTCPNKSVDFCTDCVVTQMYSENPHPLTHKFVILQDDKTNISESDSETTTESDFEKSDSYESDKNNTAVNKLSGANNQENSSVENGQKDHPDFDSYSNYVDLDNPSGGLFNMEYPIFNDPQNISYDYLHTNMLLDDT